MEELKNKLERRYQEITSAASKQMVKVSDVKTFFDRILDFINFIETDKTLKAIIEKLRGDKERKAIEDQLIKDGDKILSLLRADIKAIRSLLSEKKIVLPTNQQVIEKYGTGVVFSPTVDESAGQDIEHLEYKLSEHYQNTITDVPKLAQDLSRLIWDINTLGISDLQPELQKYENLIQSYKKKLEELDRRSKYLRIPEYEKLYGVHEVLVTNQMTFGSIPFHLSQSYRVISGSPFGGERLSNPEIPKEVEEYRLTTERVYNAILDALDNKKFNVSWWRKIINWFIELAQELLRDKIKTTLSVVALALLGLLIKYGHWIMQKLHH